SAYLMWLQVWKELKLDSVSGVDRKDPIEAEMQGCTTWGAVEVRTCSRAKRTPSWQRVLVLVLSWTFLAFRRYRMFALLPGAQLLGLLRAAPGRLISLNHGLASVPFRLLYPYCRLSV